MATNAGMLPPPAGVTPDLSGSRTKLQNQIIVTYAVLTSVTTLALGLRLYTRIAIRNMAGLDDVLIVLSWFGCIAWLVVCFESFKYGFGRHIWNVTLEQVMNYSRMLIGIMIVYVWTPALTKLSLLTLFHRLDPDPRVRGCIYGLAFLVFGYSLAITIAATGPCNPLKRVDPQCLTNINLFMSIINITTDFLILCLPMPMLYRLLLPRKQKILLGLIFTLGSGVVVISMVRIIYIYHWISNADFTYYQAAACIFSAAELNGGVICACSALLKPFLEQYFPRILALSSSGSRDESEGRRKKIFKKIKFGQDRQKQVGNPEAAEERVGAVGENHIAKASTVNVQGIKTERDVGESTEDLWAGSKD